MEKYIKLVLKACPVHITRFYFKKTDIFFSGSAFLPRVSGEMVTEDKTFRKHSPYTTKKGQPRSQGLFLLTAGERVSRGPWERGGQKKENLENFTATYPYVTFKISVKLSIS